MDQKPVLARPWPMLKHGSVHFHCLVKNITQWLKTREMHMRLHSQRVFLGSSRESEWFAREIEGSLQRFDIVEVDAWYHFGTWSPGASTLESLEARLRECDFAVLVLSNDDWTQSKDVPPVPAPRDNVVFELGLFMGRLGRDRAFFFYPDICDFKLPSDLFGITAFPFKLDDREKVQSVVSPACTEIAKQIEKVAHHQRNTGMQVRPKLDLKARFPTDHGATVDGLDHLSAAGVSILRIRASVDDDAVTDLRVYFDPRLNFRKATWTYKEDTRGRYFWASEAQLESMKKGDSFFSFELDHPKKGRHPVEVVALIDEQPRYEKKFVLNID
ncbi:nucleotide-binding protein [Pseudomonas akapageensis]|uniref:nucleotide-binding protein n=1 Tax=Pseudomonas akapageensis TaxID=2609961 RepID=UPI00140D0BC5|nr:nucleotide-binding protein [Pseudomonas akapageensis]